MTLSIFFSGNKKRETVKAYQNLIPQYFKIRSKKEDKNISIFSLLFRYKLLDNLHRPIFGLKMQQYF